MRVYFYPTDALKERLDTWALDNGVSRTEAISRLLSLALRADDLVRERARWQRGRIKQVNDANKP